jgi:RNA polymerase sigma factor (sigma-70 family)
MAATATTSPLSLETLLSESAWAVRLARALVHDQAAAEDLVQDGWVAALRARPAGDRPIRPWLRRVLRNRAHNQAREQRRREARDAAVGAAVAAGAGSQSPDELVERLRLQRLLADLVMGIPEPLRQTLLLRYYEGMSGADIARKLAVPEGTIRWRLKDALDRLRAELAGREGQGGRSWRLVLAPLAGTTSEPVGAIGLAAATEAGASKTLVSAPVIVALALAAAATVGAAALAARHLSASGPAEVSANAREGERAGERSSGRDEVVGPVSTPVATAGARSAPARRAAAAIPRLSGAALAPQPPRPATRPDTIPGQPVVTGSLDRDTLRRVVRRHINEVKWCYEQEMTANPRLEGRVEIQFTVGAGGAVVDSALKSSTLGNPRAESCIVRAARRWSFPEPEGGGTVDVTYPFVLTPGRG